MPHPPNFPSLSWRLRQLRLALGLSRSHYPDPTHPKLDRLFEVDNWILSDFVSERLIPLLGTRPFPLSEQLLMAGAMCWWQPTHVFEWGTHIGKSARLFYETGRTFSLSTAIHSIDLPDDVDHVEHPGAQRGLLVRGLPSVHLHLGDGLATAIRLFRLAPADATCLFFVDGDHSYDSVTRELGAILAAFPTAAVLLHDTFYQVPAAHYNVGPHQAVHDILQSAPGRYQAVSVATGLPGMTFIYPHRA